MINNQGIIQNNSCITEFLRKLKSDKVQYKTLNKKEERAMIEKYVAENNEDELRKLLAMHNIRLVFSIAKRYCKRTRDFDNMVAKGLFGLVYAANTFRLFEPIKIKIQIGTSIVRNKKYPYNPIIDPETGLEKTEPIYYEKIKINSTTGKPDYVKFCTHANSWIFKYVMDEFNDSSIKIDNNSISVNDKVKIKNSSDNNQTMENYINNLVSLDHKAPKTSEQTIYDNDMGNFYGKINEFVQQTNELTSIEKKIIIDTYYNHKKTKDIAEEVELSAQNIVIAKKRALKKIKKFLTNRYNVSNMLEI
jgi:DNA-directed RNA polymerase specialized sigma subunit